MNLNKEPIKVWFGFSRRERRSSFILLIILIIIIAFRYSVPEKNTCIEYISTGFSPDKSIVAPADMNKSATKQLLSFDPNTASYDTLVKLGLDSKEAGTLIKYRNKGGKFRTPSDIKKIYGIDGFKAERLVSQVEVASDTSVKFRGKFSPKQKSQLNINICDSVSLVRLSGIGPILSSRIIKYRHLLGGFASVNQLSEVYGLPAETFDLIKGRVYADSSEIRKININSADYKELSHHPYFEKYEVTTILKYRELKGRISGITELVENKLMTVEKAAKVKPYLRFE